MYRKVSIYIQFPHDVLDPSETPQQTKEAILKGALTLDDIIELSKKDDDVSLIIMVEDI